MLCFKHMSKTNIALILITLLAAVLRFWHLGSVPVSPDWDEAAWGYNAFSLLHTGRDEYGKLLPIVLQSFNVFPPALYAYLTIPAVALLGLTTFATRAPSAFFGVLSVVLTYFVVKELFKRVDLALVATFLLAISPWAIQFSRFAHEGNIAIVFNLLAVLFFLKGLKKPYFLILCAIASGLSFYAYNSEKIFAPLLMLALIVIYRKDLFIIAKKYLFLFFAAGVLVIMPMVFTIIINPTSLNRVTSTNFITETAEFSPLTPKRVQVDRENKDYLGLVMDNRKVVYLRQIAGGYLSHFDPNWLFIKGDQPRHHAPGMGLLYLWELPFLLIGIYFFIFNESIDKRAKLVLFTWFLISAIPASITRDVPHAGRTLNFLPTFQIFIAAGLIAAYYFLNDKIKNKPIRYFFIIFFISIASFNFVYFLNQYFVQQNYFNSKDWQYGWKQAVSYAADNSGNYRKVVVSNVTPLDQSYIFFLFNLKYPPRKYNSGNHTIDNHNFENYEFRKINWDTDKNLTNTLFVGTPGDFVSPPVLKTIKYLDGDDAIQIVKSLR
jgi:4-amino-4-deoxy-L-arabinose transferase-like glycosyltransferase